MGSLYLFLNAGLFPVAGQEVYYLHGARVPRFTFRQPNGKAFVIIGENAGPANIYVQRATLSNEIPYQTIVALAESPRKAGIIYAGTDDGHLQVTEDDGKTWTDVTANLPVWKWISRVVPSQHADGTVYVTERGREDDDFAPYVYRSTDFGKTFTRLVANLPAGPVNVIRESPRDANRLFVGTDFGAFMSADGGKTWDVLGGNLPSVQVSDLQFHGRDNIIVIATYGRGMYVLDAMKLQ